MDTSDVESESRASRRRSTRDKRQTVAYSPEGSASKRKRNAADNGDDIDTEESSEDEGDDGEPDEEEIRERRRKARKSASAKPATKKPKKSKADINGTVVDLAIRPAAAGAKKAAPARRKAKQDMSAEQAGGIYADVFARGKSYDDAASEWLTRFEQHEARAIAEVFNFVLKCAGCDLQIDEHEAQDPDHFPDKLRDMQDEYQAQNVADYPIIARGRAAVSFRASMESFFSSLIQVLANSGLLYRQTEIMENIEAWVGTMSSAANRPFRHTATVVSLCIASELASIAAEVTKSSADFLRMSEGEKKKKSVNKGRLKELESKVNECNSKREKLNDQINSWFETVFLHRYRDIDPRIRVDCVRALGSWISTYPDYFFDGQYLRYLGWVLSDLHAQTRQEVISELHKLYQDNNKIAGLKTFTERFRSRLVEMATRDVEPSVRAATVGLLGTLREAQLLEPDDIDFIGQLIFDSEPRVRDCVVDFFTDSVNELVEAKKEELGGDEALEDAAGGDDDENFGNPRIEWLTLKSLVELLQAYGTLQGDMPENAERWPSETDYALFASGIESKYSVAAKSLYNTVAELRNWRILAGYVLYDHSRSSRNGLASSAEGLLRTHSQLNEAEEVVLLELLNAAVKVNLTQTLEAVGKGKLTKKERDELAQSQEDSARHLASIIPLLLKKFGAQPESAAAVLRLERVLNLEIFQELRQDSTTYTTLLNDINKQFLSHSDKNVLAEASAALLHAREFDNLDEITETKTQELWRNAIDLFRKDIQGIPVTVRGGAPDKVLSAWTSNVLRLSNLARIADCTDLFESALSQTKAKGKRKSKAADTAEDQSTVLSILLATLQRGLLVADTTADTDALEDDLVSNTVRAIFYYLGWKIKTLSDKIASSAQVSSAELESIAQSQDEYIRRLTRIIEKRKGPDDLRFTAASHLIDLHCTLVSLRQARDKRKPTSTISNDAEEWTALVSEVQPGTQVMLRDILSAAERAFAKKSGKRLEVVVDDDEDPLSDDEDEEEDGADDDDEADEQNLARREERLRAALLTEQRLCEIAGKVVLGIIAGVIDGKDVVQKDGTGPMRKRLERNKAKLGPNFKQVVDFVDVERKKSAKAARVARSRSGKDAVNGVIGKGKAVKSKEMIEVSDIEEEEEQSERDEEMLGNEDPEDLIDDVENEAAREAPEEVESVMGD